MWKIFLLGLGVLVLCLLGLAFYLSDKIYLREQHAVVKTADFQTGYPLAKVHADYQAMLTVMRRVHPDFELIFDQQAMHSYFASTASSAPAVITRQEAYRLLAPLNELFQDGHTYLRRPAEEWEAYRNGGGLVLPVVVSIEADQLVVKQDLSETKAIPAGTRLISINGVPAEQLAAFSMATQSGENQPLRRAYAEQGFPAAVWEFGLQAPFVIEYKAGLKAEKISYAGLEYTAFVRQRNASAADPYQFELLSSGSAYLAFNDMSGGVQAFAEFLQQTFASIATAKPAALIIDLRNNGGGDSRLGDMLEAYLSKDDLPAIERVEVHVTEDIKQYYRSLLPSGFRWFPLHRFVPILWEIAEAPNGSSFDFFPDNVEPQLREDQKDNRYDGPLYVLIGPRTFSSAVIFAAPLKHFKRAVFVGQETGEPLIFFGENYIFDLPVTKLQAQVSHKQFHLVGATNSHTGIVPDIDTSQTQQDAFDAALEAISALSP